MAYEKPQCNSIGMYWLISSIRYSPHGVLLDALQQKCGVDETALPWRYSYLRSRLAKVLVGKEFSKSTDLSFSVPQGIICGPLLCPGCASTMPGSWVMLMSIRCMIHLILGVVGNEYIVLRKLETSIKSVNQWMNLNQFKMNNDNTEFLLVFIRSRHQVLKCESNLINVCDVTVTKSDSLKYLGVHINGNSILRNKYMNNVKLLQ